MTICATTDLLQAKADINAIDEWDRIPLHDAAKKANSKTIKVLIEAGADLNAKNAKRQTPLHRTALSIRWVESMHLLLDARASARIEDWNGQTPFDLIKGDTAWIQEYATYKHLKAASGE